MLQIKIILKNLLNERYSAPSHNYLVKVIYMED